MAVTTESPADRRAGCLGIGALAKQAGVRIDTVRYYERRGLLAPKSRLPSGYRRYGATEIARLRFIRRAQALGFSLQEIRELLALSQGRDVARVKRVAQAKLADVEARIRALQRVHGGLASLIDACPGHGEAADCPILRALGADEPESPRPPQPPTL
jgi:MerR family copper efflux transcriptional regulator